jgi:hypothetical protein
MAAVAALQAAGLSSAGLTPPPLTLRVAGALNLDSAGAQKPPAAGSGGAALEGGRLATDTGARVSGAADTSKRWHEQLRHSGGGGGEGAAAAGAPPAQRDANPEQAQRSSGTSSPEAALLEMQEIWSLPSLDLGIAPLPPAAAAAGAGAGPPAGALSPVREEAPPSGRASPGAPAPQQQQPQPQHPPGAPSTSGAAPAPAGAEPAPARPRPRSLPPGAPRAGPGLRGPARGYGEEEMFSIRRSVGGAPRSRPRGPVAPGTAVHPAMGAPRPLAPAVVEATPAPGAAAP